MKVAAQCVSCWEGKLKKIMLLQRTEKGHQKYPGKFSRVLEETKMTESMEKASFYCTEVQYCAKVMQTIINEYLALFSLIFWRNTAWIVER